MGKSTISMAIFNSYVSLPEGIWGGPKMHSWSPYRLGQRRLSGPADQRISGPADQRTSGSADQRTSGPADEPAAAQRTSGSADQRTSGPADQRISGSADQRISGPADQRTSGSDSPTIISPLMGATRWMAFTGKSIQKWMIWQPHLSE